MKVFDIFSWLPAQEMSLEKLEQVFVDYKNGLKSDSLMILSESPKNITENIAEVKNELIKEGKQVAYVLKNDMTIAVIGYRE